MPLLAAIRPEGNHCTRIQLEQGPTPLLTSNAYMGNILILQCGFGGESKKLDDLKAVADWFILLRVFISNF